jgi:hypothetical protein
MRILLATILSSCLLTIQGQVQEQLTPTEKKQLTRVTEPITLYKGFFRARTSIMYFAQDNTFDSDGRKTAYKSISGSGVSLFTGLQYGITDRLEVEIALPYQATSVNSKYTYQIPYTGETGTAYGQVKANGFSDLYAGLRYQLLKKNEKGVSAMLGLGTYLPTGKKDVTDYKDPNNYNATVGKGEFGLAPEFRIRKVAYPFSFEFSVGYIKYLGANKLLEPDGDKVKVISGSEFLIRPQINFHLNDWISLTHYIDYYGVGRDDFEGVDTFGAHNNEYDQWAIRYYPGINFQVKQFRLEQAVMIPLKGKTITADPQFFFGVDYVF